MIKEKIYTYLLACGLGIIILMVAGVFLIVLANGLPYFWEKDIVEVTHQNGTKYLGEMHTRQKNPYSGAYRIKMKIGNRDVGGRDFIWIDEIDIAGKRKPAQAIRIERMEWGAAFGLLIDASLYSTKRVLIDVEKMRKKIHHLEKSVIGRTYKKIQKLKEKPTPRNREKLIRLEEKYEEANTELTTLYEKISEESFRFGLISGDEKEIQLSEIVSISTPNQYGFLEKLRLSFHHIYSFIFSNPRESNTEGGVYPALFGTVLLVFVMSIMVFPLGVITAIYLNEYAKPGFFLSAVRITIFNLAGVPSIVYGVFGLGFFIYTLGGTIDQFFFSHNLPSPTFGTGGILWASLTLAILTLPVVVVATIEGLESVPQSYRDGAYALSATKWETIRDIVIPNAMPGMMTGLILAISRAAGEVAPLMITGVVKLAAHLPLDGEFPYLHLGRKFMHLGFHIYDVGFQSPNVEAARPMVFNTTLLLLVVIFILNLVAIFIRNKLKKQLMHSGV